MRQFRQILVLLLPATLPLLGCCPSGSSNTPGSLDRGYYPRFGPLKPHEVFSDEDVIALAIAAQEGNIEELNRLSEQGIDVNAVGRGKITPLLCAFSTSNKAGYTRLLELGASPNIQTNDGLGIMYFASAAADDSEWIELALRFGGDPNFVYARSRSHPKSTPIFSAINRHHVRAVELLIEAGVDLTHKNDDGQTAMGFALINHRYDIVYLLLRAGADHRDGLVLRETAIERTRRYLEHPHDDFLDPEQVQGPWAEKCLEILEERQKGQDAEKMSSGESPPREPEFPCNVRLFETDTHFRGAKGDYGPPAPTVSVGPVNPGPPAATYPLLAPEAFGLTQNEYSRPFFK